MEAPRLRCILFAPAEYVPASSAPIFGLHVVERTVLAFLRAGVREFLVVGDPEGARWIAGTLASRRFGEARVRVLNPESSLLPVLEREEPEVESFEMYKGFIKSMYSMRQRQAFLDEWKKDLIARANIEKAALPESQEIPETSEDSGPLY